jgi:hypothetical protein
MRLFRHPFFASPLDPQAGAATRLAHAQGLRTFGGLVKHIAQLPYGRNSDRADWTLVLAEHRGTCSTKHAFLAAVGRENGLDVRLILWIYAMSEGNTPGVGAVLSSVDLPSLPEAHCLVRTPCGLVDATHPPIPRADPPGPPLHIEEIEPEGIGDYKAVTHRKILASWLAHSRPRMTVEEAWAVREACIRALSRAGASSASRLTETPGDDLRQSLA